MDNQAGRRSSADAGAGAIRATWSARPADATGRFAARSAAAISFQAEGPCDTSRMSAGKKRVKNAVVHAKNFVGLVVGRLSVRAVAERMKKTSAAAAGLLAARLEVSARPTG